MNKRPNRREINPTRIAAIIVPSLTPESVKKKINDNAVYVNLKRYVKNKDKKRKNYYNYYTMQRWKQVENYDLVNSDIGIDEAVAAIVAIYHKSKAS